MAAGSHQLIGLQDVDATCLMGGEDLQHGQALVANDAPRYFVIRCFRFRKDLPNIAPVRKLFRECLTCRQNPMRIGLNAPGAQSSEWPVKHGLAGATVEVPRHAVLVEEGWKKTGLFKANSPVVSLNQFSGFLIAQRLVYLLPRV
eukprot:40765-Pyramimonas_sp.AAC.2